MNDADLSASQHVQFIDDYEIDWHNVRRTRFLFYQRFYYEYPGPIHDLKQRLIVIPAERYGAQQVGDHYLAVNPSPVATRQTADSFGNRILEVKVPQANRIVSFELLMIIESEAHHSHHPSIALDDTDYLLQHTPLTAPDTQIEAVAHQLQDEATTPYDLAQRINDWVYRTMRYQRGMTTVTTTAAEALALGARVMSGLCPSDALRLPSGTFTSAVRLRAFAWQRGFARLGRSVSTNGPRTR